MLFAVVSMMLCSCVVQFDCLAYNNVIEAFAASRAILKHVHVDTCFNVHYLNFKKHGVLQATVYQSFGYLTHRKGSKAR